MAFQGIAEAIVIFGIQGQHSPANYTVKRRFRQEQAMRHCQAFILAGIHGITLRHVSYKLHEYICYAMSSKYEWSRKVQYIGANSHQVPR